MEVKSSLQLYEDFLDDAHAASLGDFLGELDEWGNTNYLEQARELRHTAAAEAVLLAFQQPGEWFGRDSIGRVRYVVPADEFEIVDPIGTPAWSDIDLPDAIKTVADHLVLIWEEWE